MLTDESAVDIEIALEPSHEDVAALACALWEERGRSDGEAEQDWFEAERRLRTQRVKGQAA